MYIVQIKCKQYFISCTQNKFPLFLILFDRVTNTNFLVPFYPHRMHFINTLNGKGES